MNIHPNIVGNFPQNIRKEKVSPTLSQLLEKISPKELGHETLPAAFIGNIVTSRVKKFFTPLLLDLSIMVQKKETVQHLYDYGAVASYDELRRFKISSAVYSNNQQSNGVLQHCSQGLVQCVADNYDCNISSMNGKKQTHSLALIMIQHSKKNFDEDENLVIPRLKRHMLKDSDLHEVTPENYIGPKKPHMPKANAVQNILPRDIESAGSSSARISINKDILFLHDITSKPTSKAISAMEKMSLVYLGDLNAPIADVVSEATKFFGFCYNISNGENMSEKRYHAWLRKTSGKLSAAPKLSSLPSTTAAFTQNVLRAHLQCAVSLSALNPDPPDMDPENFGWKRDVENHCLVPVTLPPCVPALPEVVQKLMACGCQATEPCSKGKCSCRTLHITCTIFCKCTEESCRNPYTVREENDLLFDDLIHKAEEADS